MSTNIQLKNAGFYQKTESKSFTQTRSFELNGSLKTATWNRNVINYDDVRLKKTSSKTNGFGTYVANDKLYVDGIPIAKRNHTSQRTDLHKRDSQILFGDATVGQAENDLGIKCINITLDNYNRLLSREIVPGYKAFDIDDIYNIVEDVSTANDVYLKVIEDSENGNHYLVNGVPYYDIPIEYGLYNNLQGYHQLTENVLNYNTFVQMDIPHLSVHDPALTATPGERVWLTYMVDTHLCDMTLHDNIGSTANGETEHHTFTVIVKDKFGHILYKNTTYAGVFKVKLNPFLTEDGTANYVGDTWYTVEVIDWRGVGGIVIYYDLLIKGEDTRTMYEMTAADLDGDGVVKVQDNGGIKIRYEGYDYDANSETEEAENIRGFRNKHGFQRLFEAVANAEDGSGNKLYKGITLYNPDGDFVYMIDYHKNLDTYPNVDTGSIDFYVCEVENGVSKGTGQHIVKNAQITIPAGSMTITKNNKHASDKKKTNYVHSWDAGTYTVDADNPIDWIIQDGAHLFRVGGNGSDKDKIYVRWVAEGDELKARLGDNPEPDYYTINSEKEVHYDSDAIYYKPYLRTQYAHNGNHGISIEDGVVADWQESDGTVHIHDDGIYYVVKRSAGMGYERLVFPNNFTADFNNVTWKAVYCIDLMGANILELVYNKDTHIINGKCIGLYRRYRDTKTNSITHRQFKGFVENFLVNSQKNVVGEALSVVTTYSSKYCSYENMEFSDSIGYDGRVRGNVSGHTVEGGVYSKDNEIMFNVVGYIDGINNNSVHLGELVDVNDSWGRPSPVIAAIPESSKEFAELLYDSNGNSYNGKGLTYDPSVSVCLITSSGYKEFNPRIYNGSYGDNIPAGAIIVNERNFYTDGGKRQYYNTKANHFFIYFYKYNAGSDTYTFVSSVKTAQGRRVKMPDEATHIRVTIYGISKEENGTVVSYNTSSGQNVSNSNGINFKPGGFSINNMYKNCVWHDTRSSAYANECKTLLVEGCHYYRIVDMHNTHSWGVTQILGAHEDGGQSTSTTTFKNCAVEPRAFREDGVSPANNYSSLRFINARNLTFVNNTGFSFGEVELMHGDYVCNNVFNSINLLRTAQIPAPHCIYRHNVVTGYGGTTEYIRNGASIYNNRSEETPQVKVVMEDYFASHNTNTIEKTSGGSIVWQGEVVIRDSKVANYESENMTLPDNQYSIKI